MTESRLDDVRWMPGDIGASRLITIPLIVIGGILTLLILGVIASAISNIGLPTRSAVVERLSSRSKARLAEYFRLHASLGSEIWPGSEEQAGWGETPIPVIVHNEAYAFLVGFPGTPPDGWQTVPAGQTYGGPWEIVPDDTFHGDPYYRQPLDGTTRTPENFTVKVGDRWVATLFTKEYARISFYQGFRQDLPPFLRPIIPYRLLYSLVLGPTETYVEGLCHEAFHAYQGMRAPARFAANEGVHGLYNRYPWHDDTLSEPWRQELDLLRQGAHAASNEDAPDEQVADLARAFLARREARRAMDGMSPTLIDYERKREWLEGLAKYSELKIGLEAHHAVAAGSYTPVPGLNDDPRFRAYRNQVRYWNAQIDELQRMTDREEIRFYHTGMAQAVMLDRLMPDWKTRIWMEDVWLEELLAESVNE